MAKTNANTTNNNTEARKFTVNEILESTTGLFCQGFKKNSEGKTIYFATAKGEDGKMDEKRTKVAINLCLPASKDKENEESKWIVAGVTISNAKVFKEAGIDLGQKLSTPIRVRYSMIDYDKKNEDGSYTRVSIREIVNVGTYSSETKTVDWAKKPTPAPTASASNAKPATEEPLTVEVDDEDLPF